MKYGLPIVAAVLLLTGCLSVETTIELGDDGSGRLEIEYVIDTDLYDLGVFDNSDVALPIPVSRNEFRDIADRIPGLRLRSYRSREGDSTVTVTARLRFDSVEALNAWYGPSGSITVTERGGEFLWLQMVSPGSGSGDEGAAALAESLEGYSLTYRLRAPDRIVSVSEGEISADGRTAMMTVSLSAVAMMEDPRYWEVRW